jgi:hypothetical protein
MERTPFEFAVATGVCAPYQNPTPFGVMNEHTTSIGGLSIAGGFFTLY